MSEVLRTWIVLASLLLSVECGVWSCFARIKKTAGALPAVLGVLVKGYDQPKTRGLRTFQSPLYSIRVSVRVPSVPSKSPSMM